MTGVLSEHIEACLLMRAVTGAMGEWPELEYFAAVPNGGHRAKATATKLKAEGVKRGVPDYMFPLRRGGYAGLAIELKRVKGGQTSAEQRAWITWLRGQGWRAEVCKGWEEAWAVVRDYLAGDGAELMGEAA